MRIIAIDPGLRGALAFLGPAGTLDVVDMPVAGGIDPYGVAGILARWGSADWVVIEQQQAMPGQGVSSSFKTGVGYGALLGVCATLERPVVIVRASQWTKALGVGSDKGVHRRRAMDLWPAQADLFSRVKDDGRADAALIAWWAATAPERCAA